MAEHRHDLVRLSDSDFDVARGDIDPRGWDVYASDGRKIGEVDELIGDTSTRKVRYLECDLDKKEMGLAESRHALIPVGHVRLDQSQKRVNLEGVSSGEVVSLPASVSDIGREHEARFGRTATEAEGEARLKRSEEELDITKRDGVTGDVELTKRVETEHVTRPVSRMHEEVEVERRPAERGMRAGEAEFRDEEIRIPVREEEIEVRKHPEVKEEVVVRTRPVVEEEEVEADLRRERIDVEKHGSAEERNRLEERKRFGRERGR
jgi:uncharacterized protein (TIGR02271 family)